MNHKAAKNHYSYIIPETEKTKESFDLEYILQRDQTFLLPKSIKRESNCVSVKFDGGDINDEIKGDNNFLEIKRTWKITEPGYWKFHMIVHAQGCKNEIFVPAVMYRCNDMGKGVFPKGGIKGQWSFMEDRIPVPSYTHVYNSEKGVSLCTEPAQSSSFFSSISTIQFEDYAAIGISIPGQEKPFIYSGKKKLEKTKTHDECFLKITHQDCPFEYSRVFYLSLQAGTEQKIFSHYRKMMETLENKWPHSLHSDSLPSWDTYYRQKLEHLVFLSEKDNETGLHYIKMGKGNGSLQNIYDFTSSSFLVKSLEGALILAKSRGVLDRNLSELAISIGRFFLQGEVSPGIHRDNFDIRNRIWGGYLGISESDEYKELVNSRCNGETMRSYIQLYRELKKQGIEVKEFLELPQRVSDFYLKHQILGENEGSFGRWWTTDGKIVNQSGTNGAYIVSFLIELEPFADSSKQLKKKILKAAEYYSTLVEKGDFYGDTLDADAYDKESGTVLLGMFLDIYEKFGDRKWLIYAERSAEFILSWIWQYNSQFPDKSPLNIEGFQTLGMTSVSVAHHHLDFYGISIAYDFLRLDEYIRNDFYKLQAIKMMDSCRQLLFFNKNLAGKSAESSGWQPEQINHTNWDYFNRKDHGKGYFDIDIAWVTVLGLNAYLNIRERFPEVLKYDTYKN